jgi:hypothetical protein
LYPINTRRFFYLAAMISCFGQHRYAMWCDHIFAYHLFEVLMVMNRARLFSSFVVCVCLSRSVARSVSHAHTTHTHTHTRTHRYAPFEDLKSNSWWHPRRPGCNALCPLPGMPTGFDTSFPVCLSTLQPVFGKVIWGDWVVNGASQGWQVSSHPPYSDNDHWKGGWSAISTFEPPRSEAACRHLDSEELVSFGPGAGIVFAIPKRCGAAPAPPPPPHPPPPPPHNITSTTLPQPQRTHAHARTRARTHTRTHAHTHTHPRPRPRAHTHTHTFPQSTIFSALSHLYTDFA